MALATWWFEDGPPQIQPHPSITVTPHVDDSTLAAMAARPKHEIARRRAEGHRPYVAMFSGVLAAYGWVATRSASIGELDLEFTIPTGHRYLWDFATLPEFRGRGIYPHLLADIVRRECPPATRLWIIHAPENLPSGIGIVRAGFTPVAELSFDAHGRAALADVSYPARAEAAAQLLGLPVRVEALDPCWGCGGCACDHSEVGGCACAVVPTR